MIPPRAYRHLPFCPACFVAYGLASLGVVLAVVRWAGLLFGVWS